MGRGEEIKSRRGRGVRTVSRRKKRGGRGGRARKEEVGEKL